MRSTYDLVAKKVAFHARFDQPFGRVMASDPRRAIERAYFLSPAEKRAYLAAPQCTPSVVQVGAPTAVYVQVLPCAHCRIRPKGDDNHLHSAHVVSDDNGIVGFLVTAATAGMTIDLEVDCHADGERLRLPVRVTTTSSITVPTHYPVPRSGERLPALSRKELTLPNRELTARGYPPRPDPRLAPGPHARWRRLVSKPRVHVRTPPVVAGCRVPMPPPVALVRGTVWQL